MAQIKMTNIVSRLQTWEIQKNQKIQELKKEIERLKEDLRISRLKEDPTHAIEMRQVRRNNEALTVFRKWNKIREIVRRRRSAFDINEYLELRDIIKFDD